MRSFAPPTLLLLLACCTALAEPSATRPAKLPFVEIDLAARQVLVECEVIHIDAPLEFFCVAVNGPEHESVLRTPARPSDIHLALLAIGMEPGQPARFSESAGRWLPPDGPPLRVSVRLQRDGQAVELPASKLVRDIRDGRAMPDRPFVFTGSRVLEDGRYAADVTGYVVSLVNFDLSPIDVPHVASNANELLEWQTNLDVTPPPGTRVTMILQPVAGDPNLSRDASDNPDAPKRIDDERSNETAAGITVDAAKFERLQRLWDQKVAPHDAALREAAEAQYQVIRELRREQQRLIDEADRIQRLIDDLERKYQNMTTPRPED